ncbi:hypothetical protein [Salegentibacter chungangensis]|uniref:TonB C-terminal domain-containing protein n=1 Tax=Salegentibacter chungangensis TaxID=1335724 RepID=A0ABW3NSX1_9FLAO
MRKLQLFALLLAIFSVSVCKADPGPSKTFTAEVYQHLQSLPLKLKEELKFQVKFSLNTSNEIEIISVGSDDPYVNHVIKKRLEGKKMRTLLDPSIKEYKLPISIQL